MRPVAFVGAVLSLLVSGPAWAQSGVYVQQIGSANQAKATQDTSAVSGRAAITQDGEKNIASIIQQEGSHKANITQTGMGNEGTIVQQGSSAHEAIVMQTGSDNRVSLAQTAVAATQEARIIQEGERNQITLSQTGATNKAELSQFGNDNTMALGQTGGGVVTWTQEGSGLANVELVVGGSQIITLTQTRP
jgi:hypothetical protein